MGFAIQGDQITQLISSKRLKVWVKKMRNSEILQNIENETFFEEWRKELEKNLPEFWSDFN